MDFHISRHARILHGFDESLLASEGDSVLTSLHAVRALTQRMNSKRDLVRFPEQAVKAGQINAVEQINQILLLVIQLYTEQRTPDAMQAAISWLTDELGKEELDSTLHTFVDEYPPLSVYRRETDTAAYLQGHTGSVPNRQLALGKLLLLRLANENPAFSPFLDLFDDAVLAKESPYLQVISSLHAFFDTQPSFGPDSQNLVDMLRSPAVTAPHSLPGQMRYIQERWGYLLGSRLYRLLSSLDLIREEEKATFLGPGQSRVYDFAGLELEEERFSPDLHWMPRLVLIAKNTYVWLDQLSKEYGRAITRLDRIPDEELDTLARRGFTGLWLIGLWERSVASRRIKRRMGNADAVASAYSLSDYQVAADLGGEEAFQNLKERAWSRGIRMASDMVPNHMGIDSRWMIEHPDWFISLDRSPFPSYSFSGPNLASDDRVEVHLEDHYYDHSDAAVVFKRVDSWTGSERYVYHGNDGTGMPWNDTAQLDYLNPEVREAVIQTVLGVARQFPIIRFDAAMTLSKRHYRRLWYPEPGGGGDIPSRAEHGMAKVQFDALMPGEFWREVVDRVAEAAPDTLLLAEAFWLMEGYFVRTLGMHRVYNSAFMNMLRDEDNDKYRTVLKNTLEFDPGILQRYVNFMSNPDERTAADQFDKNDKYFGICTMMMTLPGLPMFGHGQIEGYAEKYGMEFQRAYWDEQPDQHLVERHEREVFPLLRSRHLFAGAERFLLYDFHSPEGDVNDDVFAYSNQVGDERALVIYHNRYATARGWIRSSVAYLDKSRGRTLVQKSLADGLELHNALDTFCLFRDQVTGLEYIRSNKVLFEEGLYVELGAYKRHVFIGFREQQDNDWHEYAQLATYLNGRGVPSIDDALREVFLQPVRLPFRELVNARLFHRLKEARVSDSDNFPDVLLLDDVERKIVHLLCGIKGFVGGAGDEMLIAQDVRRRLESILRLSTLAGSRRGSDSPAYCEAIQYLCSRMDQGPRVWGTLLGWLFAHPLGEIVPGSDVAQMSRSSIDQWLLGGIVASTLQDLGLAEGAARRQLTLIKVLTSHQGWFEFQRPGGIRAAQVLENWLHDDDVRQFLQINRHQTILWFNKQSFDQLMWWMFVVVVVAVNAALLSTPSEAHQRIIACYEVVRQLKQAEERSHYQVQKLLEAAQACSIL